VQIEDIKRLTLNPGDILVVKVSEEACHEDLDRIRTTLSEKFSVNEVLVTCGMELSVLSHPSYAEEESLGRL
jgi:hypothetical protein